MDYLLIPTTALLINIAYGAKKKQLYSTKYMGLYRTTF